MCSFCVLGGVHSGSCVEEKAGKACFKGKHHFTAYGKMGVWEP